MKKVLIITYGELSTKKDNKHYFINKLKSNIEAQLDNFNYEIIFDYGRMYIYSDDLEKIKEKLQYIFGINDYKLGYEFTAKNISLIKDNILKNVLNEKFNTFKVETKRSDKNFEMTSMDVSKEVGTHILKNITGKKVDVNNPDLLVSVEIRKDKILTYFNSKRGLGGYPVGTQGKSLLMISGGIDSPVAGYLALKRGISLDLIYFDSPPHTSIDALNKVKELSRVLQKYDPSINLLVVNFTEIQEELLKNIPNNYLITLMRIFMYDICNELIKQKKYLSLINGESIGQVASQTLPSMRVSEINMEYPVIRPVACMDKLEIIKLAKKIKTYDISIKPYDDCCTLFIPKHPIINPTINNVLKHLTLVDKDILINNAIKSIRRETLKISTNNYNNLL